MKYLHSSKTIGFIFDCIDRELVKLQIIPSNKIFYLRLSELVLTKEYDTDKEYVMKISEGVNLIESRGELSKVSYILLSCINTNRLCTYIATIGEDNDFVLKELDVLCSVIETLSQNSIKCLYKSAEEAIRILGNCFSYSKYGSLVESLFRILRKDNNNSIILNPLAYQPLYKLNSAEEYSYISSIFSQGKIKIGYLYSNPSIIVSLNDDHMLRHIAIVGSTGSGKSTTASIIAEEASKNGYAVIIIDWHGEYKSLLGVLGNVIYTNPYDGSIPEPLNLEELIKTEPLAFIEVIESALELTPAQAHILEDAVNMLAQRKVIGNYSIDLIIDIVKNSSTSSRWFTESREALLRKLKPLSSQYLRIKWNDMKMFPIEKGNIIIFDISQIPNIRIKKVIASLLIRSIVLKAQYNTISKPLLIVVDEAHNVLSSENPVSNLIAEVRKWGVGFIVATQAPSMLAPMVLKNSNTKIIHALKMYSDIETILVSTLIRNEYKKVITSLMPGEALLVIPELSEPLMIKITKFSS
ncbi:protein of unknown function DUF87 [Ignisphaera aggregans DSM 17230]|uniref:AAA+ ATPase domain-containing protein n=1 Tax=Ignisphaera aggregans (strain DSM 17230 / JCM 13409 / AQ1.S1) TaxID=583356 RepID=E0SPU0_IGNAA|nr:protein of unknown function DUF87 [Ignisphaera aggregans DSM 17230]